MHTKILAYVVLLVSSRGLLLHFSVQTSTRLLLFISLNISLDSDCGVAVTCMADVS